jgi:hypothetical protein
MKMSKIDKILENAMTLNPVMTGSQSESYKVSYLKGLIEGIIRRHPAVATDIDELLAWQERYISEKSS